MRNNKCRIGYRVADKQSVYASQNVKGVCMGVESSPVFTGEFCAS